MSAKLDNSPPESWAHERARIGSLSRSRAADDPELIEARRNLRAIRLKEYVERAISEAPALTEEQIARVAAILSRATGGDRAAVEK
jgi:hypothetical protein